MNNVTSDYDDGGIKVWCDGKIIMHANSEQAELLINHLHTEWGIPLPDRLRLWVNKLSYKIAKFIIR